MQDWRRRFRGYFPPLLSWHICRNVDSVHRLQVTVTFRSHCWQTQLSVWWNWNNLFRLQTCIAGGRIVLYWGLLPSDHFSQLVEFFLILFWNFNCFQLFYYHNKNLLLCTTYIRHFCLRKYYIKRFLFFYTLKNCHLHSAYILTTSKLTPFPPFPY